LRGFPLSAGAQHLSQAAQKDFQKREDSLKGFSFDIVNAAEAGARFRSDSQFIRLLVRTLKTTQLFLLSF